MSGATDEERRQHLAGMLKSCVRLSAQTALIVADLAEKEGRGDDAIALAVDARALLTFLEQIEGNVFRGRVNENVRAAPGALVPKDAHTDLDAALTGAARFSVDAAVAARTIPSTPKPRAFAPTAADYDALGGPPPDWRNLKDDEPTE